MELLTSPNKSSHKNSSDLDSNSLTYQFTIIAYLALSFNGLQKDKVMTAKKVMTSRYKIIDVLNNRYLCFCFLDSIEKLYNKLI